MNTQDRKALRHLGGNIITAMPERMTQKELAKLAGIGERSLNDYCRGLHAPSAIALKRIATALECTTDELLEGVE